MREKCIERRDHFVNNYLMYTLPAVRMEYGNAAGTGTLLNILMQMEYVRYGNAVVAVAVGLRVARSINDCDLQSRCVSQHSQTLNTRCQHSLKTNGQRFCC